MKVCTCFLLFRIFAYTNSISRVRQKGDHRSVHLPQKTVPEYSYEEYSGDTNNLDDVHKLKTRGTTLTNRDMKLVFRAPRVETLTDFIQEAVKILKTYEDTAFEEFFHVLDKESRKYNYRGCKFSELMQNSNTRSILAGSLNLIRGKSVSFAKANFNEVADMMRDETYDKNVKDMLDYINSLYRNTKPNFHTVLNELKYFSKTKSMKTHNDLVQVIKSGVRDILFDHYTELNTNTRRELKEKIETFWKQFKNNPASTTEINDIPYTDPVIKSVGSIEALKSPEPYFKSDPQIKSKNKSESIVSIENNNEKFYDVNPEVNKSSIEFWIPATGYATNEISSGQAFDSSSNSNKNSQERHEEYNIQQYMTLYSEEIPYKAKALKKTEIVPISASVITRKKKVKKRPMTTSTPRERHVSSDETKKIEMLRANHDADDTKQDNSESSHDTESGLTMKHKPRAKENYDKQQKHGKADKSRSKSKHNNAQIISQYDAVIDVQLANIELLKSLGMFAPLGMDTKYDTTLYRKSAIQTEPTTRPRSMRAQAHIKPQKPTTLPKPPSRYLKSNEYFYKKQLDESKRSIAPYQGHSVKKYKNDKKQKQKMVRRSNNDTIGVKDFNKYVIKRINAIEKELNEFRFRSRINDNNTDGFEVSNVTDKYEAKDNNGSKSKNMKANVIKRLLNENHDLKNEPVNNGHTTRSNTINRQYTTNNNIFSESNVIKKEAVNATVIDNKNISHITNNNVNVTDDTKEINKEVITNNATSTVSSVTYTTELESGVTTPTVVFTRKTMAYSEPKFFFDYPVPPQGKSKHDLDPFGHMSDGIVLDNDNTYTW